MITMDATPVAHVAETLCTALGNSNYEVLKLRWKLGNKFQHCENDFLLTQLLEHTRSGTLCCIRMPLRHIETLAEIQQRHGLRVEMTLPHMHAAKYFHCITLGPELICSHLAQK